MKIASFTVVAAVAAASALLLVSPVSVSATDADGGSERNADIDADNGSIRGSTGKAEARDLQDVSFAGASGLLDASASIAEAADKKLIKATAERVPGSYIVTLNTKDLSAKGYLPASAASSDKGSGGTFGALRDVSVQTLDAIADQMVAFATQSVKGSAKGQRSGNALKIIGAFAAQMTEEQAMAMASLDSVSSVEEDGVVTISQTVPWGIDRIDQDEGTDGSYTPDSKYKDGAGVTAYIIDTGIRPNHIQFENRARVGGNFAGGQNDDCNGHGTHVAGTVGGKDYGVANMVELVGVKVLSCSGSGSNSGVIAGIEWAVKDCNRDGNNASNDKDCVMNLSLGGGASTGTDNAVTAAFNAGVFVAVAAGNSNKDAKDYSPARAQAVMTVASSTSSDARSGFSNFGSVVDIFAPGSSILSAWHTSDTATNTISGTSMASPHVCGVAALYLAEDTSRSASDLTNLIVETAIEDVVSDDKGSPNRLLHVGETGPPSTSSPTSAPTPCPGTYIKVEILTDQYPLETSWELAAMGSGTGSASTIMSVPRGYYTGKATLYTSDICVDDGEYAFTITDTINVNANPLRGDGICCGYGEGSYKVYVDGDMEAEGGDFARSETIEVMVGSSTATPSAKPTDSPTSVPTTTPTAGPSEKPTGSPTSEPTTTPSASPSEKPTGSPTSEPTTTPSASPSEKPTGSPTSVPTDRLTSITNAPTVSPKPSVRPSASLSFSPSGKVSEEPSVRPSAFPSPSPSGIPSKGPSALPSRSPSSSPSMKPSKAASSSPTTSYGPSLKPSAKPSAAPSLALSTSPTEFDLEEKYDLSNDPNFVTILASNSQDASSLAQSGFITNNEILYFRLCANMEPEVATWELVLDGFVAGGNLEIGGDGCNYGNYDLNRLPRSRTGMLLVRLTIIDKNGRSAESEQMQPSSQISVTSSCSLPNDRPYFIMTTDGCTPIEEVEPGDCFDLILRHDEALDPDDIDKMKVEVKRDGKKFKWETKRDFDDDDSGLPYVLEEEGGIFTYRFNVCVSSINALDDGGTDGTDTGKSRSMSGGSGSSAGIFDTEASIAPFASSYAGSRAGSGKASNSKSRSKSKTNSGGSADDFDAEKNNPGDFRPLANDKIDVKFEVKAGGKVKGRGCLNC